MAATDPSTTPDVPSHISLASTTSTTDVDMSTSRASLEPPPKKDHEAKRDWQVTSPSSSSRVLLKSERKPTRAEVLGWYLYGMCSYFIQTVLVPIIFPLIVTQIATKNVDRFEPVQGWDMSFRGLFCFGQKEMKLYVGLTQRTISIGAMTLSPLEWVSASWVIGLILSAPMLVFASLKLDSGLNHHQLIAAAATFVGAMFCLPSGFFKTIWIFPPYIAAIIVAHTVATACHTRHLGLMIHGYTGTMVLRRQFHKRRAISSWFSLYATAAGCLGSALMSAFTYHMLANKEAFVSLWVVSIFSGIKWLVGLLHIVTAQLRPPPPSSTRSPPLAHSLSVFTYPHAIGSLAAAFLSSLSTMCIFAAAVLYLVGQLCIKPSTLLYFWLTYFIFPLFSLPLMHPVQGLIRATTEKMQVLGFALSLITSGTGFYYRTRHSWRTEHVLLFAAIQSTSVGLLHTYGRVLVLDSAPYGKEGTFGAWHSWAVTAGKCVGFAVGVAVPGRIGTAFKVAFTCAAIGASVLIFGNVSDSGGALAAGHVVDDIDEEEEEIEAGLEKEQVNIVMKETETV